MKKKALFRPVIKSAALVGVLLAAEIFAVVHPLDLDAHSIDEACKICLSVASFGSASVAQVADFIIDSARPRLVVIPFVLFVRSPPTSHFARGPPIAS